MKLKILKILLLFILPGWLFGQEVLYYKNFLNQIYSNHPVVKQADFIVKQAEGGLLAAKGAFDPDFQFSNNQKLLENKQYYNYNTYDINYQTPFALKIKSGMEQARGSFINPEFTNGTLGYFGIELPLLNGLLIDYKRAELKNAGYFVNQTEEQKRAIINDLILDASIAYYQWAGDYLILKNIESFEKNAEERLKLIKITYDNGDRALIDTVEALTQLQNIRLLINDATVNFYTSGINLARFLWNENQSPYFLSPEVVPDTIDFVFLSENPFLEPNVNDLVNNHPEIRSLEYNMKALEVYRKFKYQSLLPELNLQANALSTQYWTPAVINAFPFNENYKLGLSFRVPLFLRQARGEFRMADFKVKEMDQKMANKRWELKNKAQIYETEKGLINQKIRLIQDLGVSYQKLLINEDLKLKQGESSLFLINSREQKLLENNTKLLETKLKYIQTIFKQKWSLGMLVN